MNEIKNRIQKDRQMKTGVAAYFFLVFEFPPILLCVPSGVGPTPAVPTSVPVGAHR
jgi:hypothetical protein